MIIQIIELLATGTAIVLGITLVKLYQNSKKDEICKWCGQRIEWSEVENEQ